MTGHVIHQLFERRLAQATKPFNARGGSVERCPRCRLALSFCICPHQPACDSNAAFLLLMYDDEVLKPSNTARLIADLVRETHGFIWSRTAPDPNLLSLLQQPQWQPYVIFPAEYASEGREVVETLPPPVCSPDSAPAKRPLFILLDGSWREARRMFRKSPYLDGFPLLSFSPQTLSRYQVRKAARSNQMATAEVAARVLELAGEPYNAGLLDRWFDLFSWRYQQAVHQTNQGRNDALEQLEQYVAAHSVTPHSVATHRADDGAAR